MSNTDFGLFLLITFSLPAALLSWLTAFVLNHDKRVLPGTRLGGAFFIYAGLVHLLAGMFSFSSTFIWGHVYSVSLVPSVAGLAEAVSTGVCIASGSSCPFSQTPYDTWSADPQPLAIGIIAVSLIVAAVGWGMTRRITVAFYLALALLVIFFVAAAYHAVRVYRAFNFNYDQSVQIVLPLLWSTALAGAYWMARSEAQSYPRA
jgi:hypothetical protein